MGAILRKGVRCRGRIAEREITPLHPLPKRALETGVIRSIRCAANVTMTANEYQLTLEYYAPPSLRSRGIYHIQGPYLIFKRERPR